MGSHRNDSATGDDAEREDSRRVEQSRIPAPPSGYSRIDSLDDLDDLPPRATPPVTDEHPPLPIADLAEDLPLPETVPTEAVRSEIFAPAPAVTPHVGEVDVDEFEAETTVVRTGEPYEERAEALRSRRITDLEDEVAELRKLSRRGTLDLGLLLLRVAVGAYLAVDGCRKLFGWLGGPSLNGFETTLLNTPNPAIGFDEQSAGVVAVGWALSELVVGIFLIVGFLTPIMASLGLAVTTLSVALRATVTGDVHVFADQNGSVAFPLASVALLVTIILCGPGRYSLDGARGWARRPGIGSVAMVVVGFGVGALVWWLFNGTNPLTSPGNPG